MPIKPLLPSLVLRSLHIPVLFFSVVCVCPVRHGNILFCVEFFFFVTTPPNLFSLAFVTKCFVGKPKKKTRSTCGRKEIVCPNIDMHKTAHTRTLSAASHSLSRAHTRVHISVCDVLCTLLLHKWVFFMSVTVLAPNTRDCRMRVCCEHFQERKNKCGFSIVRQSRLERHSRCL